MAQCPRCKEEMPLLSKICSLCGYVEEGGEGGMSVDQFLNTLEKCLRGIKEVPEPSFFKSMGQLTFVIFPVLTAAFLGMALVSEAGIFWLLCLLFLVLSVVSIVRKTKGKLGNDPFNRRFNELKNEYTYNERIGRRNFGKSREVSKLLEEISDEIRAIEKRRKGMAAKNLIIWLALIMLLVGLSGLGVHAVNRAVNDPASMPPVEQTIAYAKAGQWEKAVSAYQLADPEATGADEARMQTVKAILAAGDAAAENFFLNSCMGQPLDYECATLIVLYYKEGGDATAAQNFAERCTGMRYGSDKGKLKKLATQ